MAGGYEHSFVRSRPNRDISALGPVIVELMQGYINEDDVVEIDDNSRWPSDSRAVDFIYATTYVSEIRQLLEVR